MSAVRVAVVGAGAVGGLIAARLVRAGIDVSVAARGRTLERVAERGIVVHDRDGEWSARPRHVALAGQLGPHDVVIVATKAHALAPAASDVASLTAPGGVVVSAINGLPWWYFHGLAGWKRSPHLRTVDPDGAFWNAVGPARAMGCVVHLGSSSPAPGVVKHAYGAQLVLGEPAAAPGQRTQQVADLLAAGGFKARVTDDIRVEVWRKLWSNLAINPLSLLTGAACDRISAEPDAVDLMVRMMDESALIAHALGVSEPLDSHSAGPGLCRHRRLQDVDAPGSRGRACGGDRSHPGRPG